MDMEKQIPGMDRAAQAYFNTLPVMLQEQIMQSGAKLCTKGQLENYCKNSLSHLAPAGWKGLTENSGK